MDINNNLRKILCALNIFRIKKLSNFIVTLKKP